MQLPLPLPDHLPSLEGLSPLPLDRRIYCNRSLRLDFIEMVGFDMDYTLAIYNQAEVDRLSIEATARKLVEQGYPDELLRMEYRTDFPIRGLLIDRKLGNVLKMDRHKYVKKAYHGTRELTLEERRHFYHSQQVRPATKRYHWVDTLYALSEVSVYAAVVDSLEQQGRKPDYEELFADVRSCIDLAHYDGTIVNMILRDLPKFVQKDLNLGPALHRLRSAGKRLFLLTNSRFEYTDRMMTYLLGDALPEYPSWKGYFDIIVTQAGKPLFFTGSEPLLELGNAQPVDSFERGRAYTGGNIEDFERIAGIVGERILYVGDHIYGDVLRAKKESGWRTAMVVQEMTDELLALEKCARELAHRDALEELRDQLYEALREQQARSRAVYRQTDRIRIQGLDASPELEALRVAQRRSMERIRERLHAVDSEINQLEKLIDSAFHHFWGSVFKAGTELSSFGAQVESYACLYTTRVSNFLLYSPMHYFRSPHARASHEDALVELK